MKLQDDLHMLGLKIKQHEENIKILKTQKNSLDDSILDMQVTVGKYHSSSVPVTENEDISCAQSEEKTVESILRHEKSAAAILCQLKTRHVTQASHIPFTKDVLGIVATLGKVDDDNLGWLLSEYLGMKTMLGVVCKTYDGIKTLEMYEKEGSINKSSGLHGLAASIGRPLDGRFLVFCLENLRPYVGEFVADDPQRRLDLLNPRLPNGESPPGFLGFAVNMIHIDNANLFCLTNNGHGLRETLFYHLFSHLQIYRTREDMLQALPCINHGALSLDGGMIRSNGVFSLGNREEADIKFPQISGIPKLPENYFEIETRIKEMKWKKERMVEDMQREEALLGQAKVNFEKKKQEFVKSLAQSSPYTPQIFYSRDELTTWCRAVGMACGVVVCIKKSDYPKYGRRGRIMYSCERSGEYRHHMKNNTRSGKRARNVGTKKCAYPFLLKGVRLSENDHWNIKVVCGRHNHPVDTNTFEGRSYVGRLSKSEEQIVTSMSICGVKPKEILRILKQSNPQNASTIATIYNFKAKHRIGK